METTLVINPGSTSKKYALYQDGAAVFSLRFEETGDGFGVCRERDGETQKCEMVEAETYKKAIEQFITEAIERSVISSAHDIHAVGVRVVAPGMAFTEHARITSPYLEKLESLQNVAPTHVSVTVDEIYAVKALITNAPIYGISDSAFHTSIPMYRKRFGINRGDADEFEIVRYGYHGLSMSSIVHRSEKFFGVAPDRVVALHVGGGVSVTALHYQESVDTTMGYSPASGVLMGSRAGDFDADALIALMARKGIRSVSVLSDYLNTEGGFQALTGLSDLRLVLNKYSEGDANAAEAMQVFRHQLHRAIGGHAAILGGLDALIFTGTAVVRNPFLRSYILDGIEGLGVQLDTERNDTLIGKEGMIHSDRSDVSIGVMRNDEMGEIARLVREFPNT